MNSYKIVFMGTPEFAVPALKALMEGPNQVVAVVTQPDRPKGRGRKLIPSPIKVLAEKAGIAVLQPEKARSPEFLSQVLDLAPDLLVVAAYGQILPQELLDIPRIMPINVHGSLLPEYRGAAPIQWAIIQGDTKSGITIMEMDAGMDTGPMLLQKALTIGPEETFGELYERMAGLGAGLLQAGDGKA
jgi:methionyl-tRNA formyltransferase